MRATWLGENQLHQGATPLQQALTVSFCLPPGPVTEAPAPGQSSQGVTHCLSPIRTTLSYALCTLCE